ncbi:hypothetical protein [Roseibium aggregatum]|uniref:hypothetical protein n=1 Tax=Roseibium aggregatum TaxID=187304 RepID=UPI001A8E9033|nr:hypothetical protein [Roseibium aggregatum]MBN8180070.1 hypothetical protein [Roseibium aggregatum]UES45767.1 hypothetical protein GFK90_19420 [Roseibium aggregatum]
MKSTTRLEITRNDLDVDRQIKIPNDKKVKSKRRKSLLDDSEFLAEFCNLCLDGSASDRLTTLVGKGIFNTSPFGSWEQDPRRTKVPRRPLAGIRSPEPGGKPKPWRDSYLITKLFFAHLAVVESGKGFAVTVNLSPEVEAAARNSPDGALNYIRRRIARRLRDVAGISELWWFAIEETDEGRLHLHGEVSCEPDENTKANVRCQLRKAGGEWKTTRQHQIQLKPITNYGWYTYATKRTQMTENIHRKSRFRQGAKRYLLPSFNGLGATMSNTTREAAKRLYEEARSEVVLIREAIARP